MMKLFTKAAEYAGSLVVTSIGTAVGGLVYQIGSNLYETHLAYREYRREQMQAEQNAPEYEPVEENTDQV